jgi:predicted nucleic acid-binding protein
MSKYFIDTNLIVYANDCRDTAKQQKALDVLAALMGDGRGVISTQVMQEYAHVALNKLGQRQDVVLRQLLLLEGFEVVAQTPALIRRSVEIRSTYQVSFWDACIVAAAEHARCAMILSEDFNTGQYYAGIAVENPFA